MSIPHSPPDWPHYQWHRLVRRGLSLGAEVQASQQDRRAWVHIWPDIENDQYYVHYYEIERSNYEEADSSYDCDHFIVYEQRDIATGIDELKHVLNQWLDDLTLLRDPGVGTLPC